MAQLCFIADKSRCPVRLDVYASEVQNISRSRLKNGLRSLTVDGKNAKLSLRLKGGENVAIDWEDTVCESAEPENIALDILFENDDVTVVNKAQGMVTHPGAGNSRHTLVNALLYHWQCVCTNNQNTSSTSFRPGIVHRLDKDTSGVLITARHIESEIFLQTEFKNRRVKKEYIAIVQGHPPFLSGEIKNTLVRSPSNRILFTVAKDGAQGKFAHTLYRCIGIYGPYSLMRITIKTGRTHQIRVHMKHLGCPVLGDPLYGKKDALFESATLMLHARRLSIRLNAGSASLTSFTAPVPHRFKKVLKTLHERFKRAPDPECV